MQMILLSNAQPIDWRFYVSENDRNYVRDRLYDCMQRVSQLRRSELRDVAIHQEARIWDYCESITQYRSCVIDLISFFTLGRAQPMQLLAVAAPIMQSVQQVASSHKRKPEMIGSHPPAKWCRSEPLEQMVD